jgi:hypothetical protein
MLAGALAAAACTSRAPLAFEVLVSIGPGATADCMNVAVWSQPDAQIFSNTFANDDAGTYSVAVFQGSLPADVNVEAFGYLGTGCTTLASVSGPSPATFGVTSSVGLTLFAFTGQDGGADSGAASDSGSADGGPGLDGGTPDSGSDAGGNDAGTQCVPLVWDGGYVPSNFALASVPCVNLPIVVDCAPSTTVDTTGFSGTSPLTLCGRPYAATLMNQTDGGPQVVVVASTALGVIPDAGLLFEGPYPIIFAIYGPAEIDGILRASARAGGGPGSGFDSRCNAGQGSGAAGGGGGGFGGNGGNGGGPPNGGTSFGMPSLLVPLEGGCSGASGDPLGGAVGGGAGGAIQISAAGDIGVSGIIDAAGAGGTGAGDAGLGGAGGGSGGAILLEGNRISLNNKNGQAAALTTNGGGGGAGSDPNGVGGPGQDGLAGSTMPAMGGIAPMGPAGGGGNGGAAGQATNGQPGNGPGGGGGGGGGFGYIRFNAVPNGCNLTSGTTRTGNYSSAGGGC